MPFGGTDIAAKTEQMTVKDSRFVSAAATLTRLQPNLHVAGGTGSFTITFEDPSKFGVGVGTIMLDSITSGTVTVAFPSGQPANVSLTVAKDMVVGYSNGSEWFRLASIAGGTYA